MSDLLKEELSRKEIMEIYNDFIQQAKRRRKEIQVGNTAAVTEKNHPWYGFDLDVIEVTVGEIIVSDGKENKAVESQYLIHTHKPDFDIDAYIILELIKRGKIRENRIVAGDILRISDN